MWRLTRVVAGLAWGGALVLLGCVCLDRPPGWLSVAFARAAGVALVGGGEFVLSSVAARALFPGASRRLMGMLEAIAGAAFWGGLGVCLYLLVAFGSPAAAGAG